MDQELELKYKPESLTNTFRTLGQREQKFQVRHLHGVQERQHLHGQQQGQQLVDPAPEDYHNPVGSKLIEMNLYNDWHALDHD